MKISITIPTFNESKNIEELIKRIDTTMRKNKLEYECIVVDDNSPDKTYKKAIELSKEYPIKTIVREEKGLASAILRGFNESTGDIIGVMDSDLQHPPEIIPELVKPIIENKVELTIGSRLVKGGVVEDWPLHRKLISKIARVIVIPLTEVKDSMSGLFFLRKEVIEGVELETMGYKLGLEIFVKGNYERMLEVPFTFKDRSVGSSKLNAKIHLEYLKQIFKLYLRKWIKK